MNKIIKEQINRLKPSATLAINEESNKLKKSGKKVYKFGFGQISCARIYRFSIKK